VESNAWYNNHNNTIEWQLTLDKTVIDHTVITRVVLSMARDGAKPVVTDSDIAEDAPVFDFSNADRLIIKPDKKTLPEGDYKADLIIYDAANSKGILWTRDRLIEVVS